MIPFLGIDLTENKKNEQHNGKKFLVQEPSVSLTQSLETSFETATETLEKAKLPKLFRILQYICGFAALLIGGGILKADVTIAQGYRNAPLLYWICGISAVVWLILWVFGKQKSKTHLTTEESEQTFSNLEGVAKAIYTELTVPANAKEVDILSFHYICKDGGIKLQKKGMQIAEYFNPEFKLFSDSEYLYLANLDGKYAIPISAVKTIHTVKKHIRINGWNKSEKFNKGIYKQYKLTTDNFGCIHCRHYHILEFSHGNALWGIYIPCYELPVFEALLQFKGYQ